MDIRDPIIELHDTKLYQQLLQIDTSYANRITTFVSKIAPIMATIKNNFPFYTRHDAHHGYQVVSRIAECVSQNCFDFARPECLTAPELFLLIASAYAHDLGMAVFPDEKDLLLTQLNLSDMPGWETNPVLQQYLRQNHSKRGGIYIDQNAEKLSVPRNLVAPLDLMMQAHNYSIPNLERELHSPYAAGKKELELAQLAVIVCVADAIEFSDTRVMDGVLQSLKGDSSEAARISYAENMKHVCTGDSLAVTSDGRIIVSGTFSDANILALAHHTFDQMEEWIQGYSDIDQRCKYRRLKVRGEPFQRNLVLSGGNFQRLGVRLNKRSVIDLIASNAVWRTNQGIALRELVQNSVEACRYRQHHSSLSDKYHPHVRITFNRELHQVTVTDNGCGMTERTVLNNLLTVGSSRSREPAYVDGDYDPIARFGIGFWSVFTISSLAKISTAAFEDYRGKPVEAQAANGISFEVQLADLKDFTVFSPTKSACGTCITLYLRPDVVIDDVYTALEAQINCSLIPVTISLDGGEYTFESNVKSVSEEVLFNARKNAAEHQGVKVFQYKGQINNTELAMGLSYRMANDRATFTVESGAPMLEMIGHIQSPGSSVCGFSVPFRVRSLCFDLLRVGTYNINALTPKGFEFSIDRQALNDNQATKQHMEHARKLIHEGYRVFLKETDSYFPQFIHALQTEAAASGGNVYDQFTENELLTAYADYGDLICTKLVPVTPGLPFFDAEKNARYMDLHQLKAMKGAVLCLQAARAPTRYTNSMYINLEDVGVVAYTYEIAQQYAAANMESDVYVAFPDRTFSMLFDNDSFARADVISINVNGKRLEPCLLTCHLENVNFIEPASDVVTEVHGRWSGNIYWRQFQTPDQKPYLFLGRYRVLIKPGSSLQTYLKTLIENKRFSMIAQVINLLKEDESGYPPASLAEYL